MRLSGLKNFEIKVLAERCRVNIGELLNLSSLPKLIRNTIQKKLKRLDYPLAYSRGFCFFMNYKFFVSNGVFIPRPETETLIEFALNEASHFWPQIKILDVCAGTGALAIALTLELKKKGFIVETTLIDKSTRAVRCICKNLQVYNILNSRVFKADLFPRNLNESFDIILCNPPYLKKTDFRGSIREEPIRALVAKENGFYTIRRFLIRVRNFISENGFILLESSNHLVPNIKKLCEDVGLVVEQIDSLLGVCFLKLTA